MAHVRVQAVRRRERIEVVMRELRMQRTRQHHGAEDLRNELDAATPKLRAQERKVEARVVRDEEVPRQALQKVRGDRAERRRGAIVRRDLPQRGRMVFTRWGADHCRPAFDARAANGDDADFRDAVLAGTQAGRLDIDEREGMRKHCPPAPCWQPPLSNDRSVPSNFGRDVPGWHRTGRSYGVGSDERARRSDPGGLMRVRSGPGRAAALEPCFSA